LDACASQEIQLTFRNNYFLRIKAPVKLLNRCLFSAMCMRHMCRFDFCGSAVLSASSGDQVSFNTTAGDVVMTQVLKSSMLLG